MKLNEAMHLSTCYWNPKGIQASPGAFVSYSTSEINPTIIIGNRNVVNDRVPKRKMQAQGLGSLAENVHPPAPLLEHKKF